MCEVVEMIENLIESVLEWRKLSAEIDKHISEGEWLIHLQEREKLLSLIDESSRKLCDMKFFLTPISENNTK